MARTLSDTADALPAYGGGRRASQREGKALQLRVMTIALDFARLMRPELGAGSGALSTVPVAVAESEVCVPVNLVLNPPETRVCVPVMLLDCRGTFFQLTLTMPRTGGDEVN